LRSRRGSGEEGVLLKMRALEALTAIEDALPASFRQ
jgi:hypothetical protein